MNVPVRSAEFYSAVPPSCTRQAVRPLRRVPKIAALAECNSAVQQSETLRYVFGLKTKFFRQAESLLVSEEVPIVPLYFFEGFNYFDDTKISGISQNPLDEHPLQYISKVR